MPGSPPKELSLDNLHFSDFIQAGDTVAWGQACAEPLSLTQRFLEQQNDLGQCKIFAGLSFSNILRETRADRISICSYGALGTNAEIGNFIDILPCNYSAIPQHIANGRLNIDVVLVQVSPKGAQGYSLGLSNDYLKTAMQHARVVIAEVNERIPYTTMDEPLDESLIDYIVPVSLQPLYPQKSTPGEIELTIAQNLCAYIEDGAVLQYGVGNLPSAILGSLSGHKDLGIYSGMITDDIMPLIESGAITNATNRIKSGVSIGGTVIGNQAFSDFLHNNPSIELHPSTKTHDANLLSKLDRLVAINSAIEVDLYGQVNAEMLGKRYIGAVGGQVDYMHAASTQANGLSVIAMPSVTGNGKHSRIVKQLNSPLLTTCKSDVDLIVTEHGVADLRGKTFNQRAAAIRAIAAPEFQRDLVTN